jgi:hypothetical protein
MSSIRLHPKHGVNPTIPICRWCGKERNEVAMLGAAYRGEAPRSMVIDNEPCDACKERWSGNVVLFEVRGTQSDYTLTGSYALVNPETARSLFQPPEVAEQVVAKGRAVMDTEAFAKLFSGMRGKGEPS